MRLFFAIFAAILACGTCAGQEVTISGPDRVDATGCYFYTLDGVAEADIENCEWACLPLSKQAEFGLALVYDPLTKERRSILFFRPRESGPHTLIFDVNVPGRYYWALKEVRVGEGPPPGPDPEPEPQPEPEPEPEPLDGWALWTKATAERVIPEAGRADQARLIADTMEATVAASAAGTFASAREFREALRAANRRALGEDVWATWNAKFDSLLSQELSVANYDPNSQPVLRALYAEIIRGLREVR